MSCVAGIVAEVETNANITNCSNAGNVTGTSSVGGIVGGGYAKVTFVNCDNTGNITANDTVGGIAGNLITAKGSTYDANCSNTGTITAGTTTATSDIGTGTLYVGNLFGRQYS